MTTAVDQGMYSIVVELLLPFALLLLLAMAAIVRLGWTLRESRRRLVWVAAPVVLLAIGSTPAFSYLAAATLEWQYARPDQYPTAVGTIVVFSCGAWPTADDEKRLTLDADSMYRCLSAAELYQRQPRGCPVILSGGPVSSVPQGPSIASAMGDFLVAHGVKPDDIVLEENSRNTYENVVETCRLLGQQEGVDSFEGEIVLVVDAIDVLRADLCFRAQGVSVMPWGTHRRADRFSWHPLTFIPSPEGAAVTQRAAYEWLGIAWYRLRGRV